MLRAFHFCRARNITYVVGRAVQRYLGLLKLDIIRRDDVDIPAYYPVTPRNLFTFADAVQPWIW
jgi:hypothetical protein